MNRFCRRFFLALTFLAPVLAAVARAAEAAIPASGDKTLGTDFLEHVVDWVLQRFGVTLGDENTTTHFVVSGVFLLAAFLLRRVVTNIIFYFLKKAASKTETTLDDKLFPALEAPVATFITVTGIFAALKVLKLSANADIYLGYGSTVAFSLVIFWGLFRAFSAILDHAQEVAVAKQMGVVAFMPWIRKTLFAIFIIIGGLLTIQSLGYDVKTLLTGLGIGGLAFALAAQDTIANLFGSIVVAIDQPFKVGETVKIGASQGTVEEIGLRSTKIRLVDQSLVAIPNRTVSNEAIVNLSRFTGRRAEQVFGLTYDTTPEQMEAMVAEVRRIITAEPEVDPASVLVYFRDLSASSLDIWSVYVTRSPGNPAHLAVRQRINLAIMRAVASRGLSFAFPTQTVIHDGPVAKKLAEK
jgi:MscS family membrane protein